MKVAIIGAGLAGLACAHELSRNGIPADIFEKKNYIGSHTTHTSATLKLFDKTGRDSLKSLRKKFHFKLSPMCPLKEMVMLSPENRFSVKGNLGYIFLRGMDLSSLENQLAAGFKPSVRFNENIRISDLEDKYDHIVVASGDCTIAKELGLWTTNLNTYVRIGTAIGKFETGSIRMWFNTEYSKHCYCYMIANSSKEASIILTADNASSIDAEYYWKTFLTIEEITYPIIETMDFEYNLGYVSNVRPGNIYFTGGSAGLTDDLVGLGVFNALESGALAARSIVEGEDYARLVRPLQKSMEECHKFRELAGTFSNEDYNKLLAFLDTPGIKQFVYKEPFSRLKKYTPVARLFNRLRS